MDQESGSVSDIDSYLREVKQSRFFRGEKVEGSFAYNLRFYRRQAPRQRRLFRASGMFVLLLSVALPVVAAFGERLPQQYLWLSVMSALIALLTGANAFFQWGTAWQGSISAQLALERLCHNWEIAIADARTNPDPAKGRETARNATERLIAQAHRVIEAETRGFFTNQRFPDNKDQDSG